MERKLASIQIIEKLEPIPGADFIVKARVMGWDLVVKRDEFEEDSPCVFFEVDSVLPDGAEWAEFMRARKFRVRTVKFKGVLSQGLALPVSILPHGSHKTGDDVSEALGVKKYEIPLHRGGAKMGSASAPFPHFVPKTDEIRLQSCLGVLDELEGHPCYITTKCDGTSATFARDGDEFLACFRNFTKKEDETNIYHRMAAKYGLAEKLPQGVAIQGEICGPGIQKNRLMLTEPELFVFTVYDWLTRRRFDAANLVLFCEEYGLRTVPIDEIGAPFYYSLEQLLEMAKGKYEGTKNRREGIVVRPTTGIYSPTLQGPLSFKVLNNDFLLKDED
jgi:RNA ligase (TIGR02306 family)